MRIGAQVESPSDRGIQVSLGAKALRVAAIGGENQASQIQARREESLHRFKLFSDGAVADHGPESQAEAVKRLLLQGRFVA